MTEWNSEALTPLDDSSAWPTKNTMNELRVSSRAAATLFATQHGLMGTYESVG